ncbi:MAG: hypothetical protein ABIH23_19250 [bacterium]
MKSRRDLLRVFGIGALIAPIIGAKADETSIAQLIEPPKVRPVELFREIPKKLDLRKVTRIVLIFETTDGERHRIEAQPQDKFGIIGPGDDQIELYFSGMQIASPSAYSASVHCKRLA